MNGSTTLHLARNFNAGTYATTSSERSRRGASFVLLERLDAGDFAISVLVLPILAYEAVTQRQARELGLTHTDVEVALDVLCSVAHHRLRLRRCQKQQLSFRRTRD